VPWWDLDSEAQARALGWARARSGASVMGVTTLGMTGIEFLRLHNGPRKRSAGGAADLAYLEGS